MQDTINQIVIRRDDPPCKFARIKEIIEDEQEGGKALIFTEWRTAADQLGQYLCDLNPVVIHGGVPDRDRRIDAFNEDPKHRVAVMTIAVAPGLEISAHGEVTDVYVLSPNWVPGMLHQAIGRARNYDNAHQLRTLYILAKDTVEPVLQKRLVNKQWGADRSVSGGKEDIAAELGADELVDILLTL